MIAWLVEGMVGMPVLAGGAGGIAHFAGPTAGYLFGFPVVAAFVGLLAERGLTRNVWVSGIVMLLGNALCLLLGAAWLANIIGLEKAWTFGVAPFIVGGVLKSALAAVTVELLRRWGIRVS